MRTFLTDYPFIQRDNGKNWQERGKWAYHWIACPDANSPCVTAYRCHFTAEAAATLRIHVTADERYELYLDGKRIGRGSERGDANHWYFETYDLPVEAGEHCLVARVWSLGEQAAFAQMSVTPGFFLAPQEADWESRIGTGIANWEAKILHGYTFIDPITAWGTGANLIVDGAAFDWGFESGEGEGWKPAKKGKQGVDAVRRSESENEHLLIPAVLPAMLEEERGIGTVRLVANIGQAETHDLPIRAADTLPAEQTLWQNFLHGSGSITIPANTRRRILIDLENYYCAYPEVTLSGGAGGSVRIHWQEALYSDPRSSVKGNRDEIEGKQFVTVWHLKDGIGDTFIADGGEHRTFNTLWWQCGRYVELLVTTQDTPLTLEKFSLRETRYPLENESEFSAGDSRLSKIIPIMHRTLQMCSHETYMDCPYFEQLQYVGDTRLQALVTYVTSSDSRLPRKAVQILDWSRLLNGLTQSRYPSRVRQMIPTFSLWWVGMVSDYAHWRDDLAFVRSLMPGVRAVLDYFQAHINEAGFVTDVPGWNYMDWVPEWPDGVPADGCDGASGLINWQYVLALNMAAELEACIGEPELAARNERHSAELALRLTTKFWNEERSLLADDLAQQHYSEHTQCLAILSGRLDAAMQARIAESLLTAPDLARTTIYFSHYLFEVLTKINRTDVLLERLNLWHELRANGLKTAIEMPEPTRSDCHAWGAHPLYHYFASLLGIRPAEMGFRSVTIAPRLGSLTEATGTMSHPNGPIQVEFRKEGNHLHAQISLPPGLTGTLAYAGQRFPLAEGNQTLAIG